MIFMFYCAYILYSGRYIVFYEYTRVIPVVNVRKIATKKHFSKLSHLGCERILIRPTGNLTPDIFNDNVIVLTAIKSCYFKCSKECKYRAITESNYSCK